MARKYVRLADESGGFYDGPETGWKIRRNEIKELPDQISDRLRRKLAAGGLIECDPPGGAKASAADSAEGSAAPAPPAEPASPRKVMPDEFTATDRAKFLKRRSAQLDEAHTVAELKALAEEMGVDLGKARLKAEICGLIAAAEWAG